MVTAGKKVLDNQIVSYFFMLVRAIVASVIAMILILKEAVRSDYTALLHVLTLLVAIVASESLFMVVAKVCRTLRLKQKHYVHKTILKQRYVSKPASFFVTSLGM
eukprot:6478991-Amphidinium_carterae.1